MVYRLLAGLLIASGFSFFATTGADGQSSPKNYELNFAPDLWYNDVDGIRVGLRTRGQVPGTFDDGPHRLDAGIWLGTWFPRIPVSYYVKYTNPIERISDFNSEGSYSITSSIRTGFHRHGIGFDKRWQPGFNDDEYTEFSAFGGAYRHFKSEYLPFPALWQDDWTPFIYLNTEHQRFSSAGIWYFRGSVHTGMVNGDDSFSTLQGELRKRIEPNRSFNVRLRLSGGVTAGDVPPEHRFMASQAPAKHWMTSGFYRAKGTVPTPWMNSGVFQVTGNGPNIRGYSRRDIKAAGEGLPLFYNQYGAFNAEVAYPNYIDRLFEQVPVLGDFLRLRSYLFTDIFTGYAELTEDWENLANAGAGFALTLNIPDQIGKPRGFVLRYDVPFWLSSPEEGHNEFRYRSVFSFGAVIGF